MKAVYLEAGRLHLREVPIPKPSQGEVLIKVKVALTDGTDLKALVRGHHLLEGKPFGHEYSGVVVETGPDVKGFKVGDEVFGVNSAPCFRCKMCTSGKYNLCEDIVMLFGGYAEYLLIPKRIVDVNLLHKSPDLPHVYAPMVEPLACVLNSLEGLKLMGEALVIGTGSIASMFCFVLKHMGLGVDVLGRNVTKLAIISKNLGVHAYDYSRMPRRKYDLVVEATGKTEVWELAQEMVGRGGTLIMFGGLPKGSHISLDAHRLHYDDIKLISPFHHTPMSVRKAARLLHDFWHELVFLISGVFPITQIEKAFDLMKRGIGFKYAIKPF